MPKSYVGRTVVIIYLDRSGQITQRTVRVTAIDAERITVYDIAKQQPRSFTRDGILAVRPVAC